MRNVVKSALVQTCKTPHICKSKWHLKFSPSGRICRHNHRRFVDHHTCGTQQDYSTIRAESEVTAYIAGAHGGNWVI